MVNHELRNALAAVYGWSEMLVRKKDPATVPRAAFEVLDSAEQAIGLINDLLDLSRLDEDRLKPVIRPIEPGQRREARHRPGDAGGAGARGSRWPSRSRRALPACETDASRVEQILVNLLGNAIQHTPDGTRSGSTSPRGDRLVVFTVRDEGPGVPATELEHIFDIYATKKEGDMRGVGPGSPALAPAGPAAGRRPASRWRPQASGGEFELELPAAPQS